MNFNKAVAFWQSLLNFTTSFWDSFGNLRSEAEFWKTETSLKRTRSARLTFNNDPPEEAEFKPSKSFRDEVFLPILDRLYAEVNKRLQTYSNLSHKFGFLLKVLHLDAKS